jgi:hypothetical protein
MNGRRGPEVFSADFYWGFLGQIAPGKDNLMLRSLRRLAAPMFAAALVGVGSIAAADVVAPGTSGLSDVFVNPTGTVLATGSGTFANSTGGSGSWEEEVLTGGISGGTQYVFQFSTNAGSTALERITASDSYAPYITDVGWALTVNGGTFLGAGTIAPVTVDRSNDGNVIGFNFPIVPPLFSNGAVTEMLVIDTNAQTYQDGFIGVLDGSTATITGQPLSPAGIALPLPATAGTGLALLGGLGILGGVSFLRRRRQMA